MGWRSTWRRATAARSGFTFDDYRQGNELVRVCSHEEAYRQDLVIVLRSPTLEEFELMPAGAGLLSMLHYPTRPQRVDLLRRQGIQAISMDSIVADNNLRLVENMKAVAWNGLEAAFDVLQRQWPRLRRPDGQPIRVSILGTGMVGKHAVEAATKLGDVTRNQQHMQRQGPGAIALAVGRNITGNADTMRWLFEQADILVDAVQRRDPSRPVVPNDWIGWLPAHAVIADLAVDPYTLDATRRWYAGSRASPRAIWTSTSSMPDDEDWDETVPASIPSQQRRAVVSCYSWPGIHPEACMRHYAQQLLPLLEPLLHKGYDRLSLIGRLFRARHVPRHAAAPGCAPNTTRPARVDSRVS